MNYVLFSFFGGAGSFSKILQRYVIIFGVTKYEGGEGLKV